MSQSKLSIFPLVLTKEPIPMSRLIPEEERNKAYLEHHQSISNLNSDYFLKEYSTIKDVPGLPVNNVPLNLFVIKNVVAVRLKNNGDLPSTNVQVKLLLKMYGSKNFYPKDSIDTNTFIDREFYDQKEININIPYIGANEEKSYKLLEQIGQFRETELILLSIKANGFTYIKNNVFKSFLYPDSRVVLNHYKHPFVGLIEQNLLERQSAVDSEHMKMFYGFLDE